MYLEKEAIEYLKNYEINEFFFSKFSSGNEGFFSSRRIGSSSEFEEYKSYFPSDNPKDIDWKKYARTEKLLTKQYESYSHTKIHFILDISNSMNYPDDKFIYAKKFLALFSFLILKEQNEVFLSCIGDSFINSIKINYDSIENIFSSIYSEKLFNYRYLYNFRKMDINFLISDGWWNKNTIEILNIMIEKRINFINLLSDKETKISKNSILIDSEKNNKIIVSGQEIIKNYTKKIEERKKFFYQKFTKNKLFYFNIINNVPYYHSLKNILDSLK
ncbi:MAG: DUF58 domain-containing protein [Brevinematales bacterium]|nr:DUF58 domain-containing protein [Brevinematales bacterium]